MTIKTKRCPNGSRKNNKTKKCEKNTRTKASDHGQKQKMMISFPVENNSIHKMNIKVSFNVKIKVIKITQMVRKKKTKEITKLKPHDLEILKSKMKKTLFLPYQVTDNLKPNQFLNENFGIVDLISTNINFKSPFLTTEFVFHIDNKDKHEINLKNVESLIYDAWNQTYSKYNYQMTLTDLSYQSKDGRDFWYYVITVEDVPENIEFVARG